MTKSTGKDCVFLASAHSVGELPSHPGGEIALAGRSNVGKSSLINSLAGRKSLAPVSKSPGKTRRFFLYKLGRRLFVVDLPGFGYAQVSKKLRESWRVAIEEYFLRRSELAGVLHLVDLRHEPEDTDCSFLSWVSRFSVPAGVVGVKADKVPRSLLESRVKALEEKLGLPERPMVFSARTGLGRKEVLAWISEKLDGFSCRPMEWE